jgi:hypothetical protein
MEQTYTWLAPSEYSVFNYRVAGYSASVVHLHAGAAAVTSDGAHLAAIWQQITSLKPASHAYLYLYNVLTMRPQY